MRLWEKGNPARLGTTNYGEGDGYKTGGGGGASELLPLQKGGGGSGPSSSHAERGAQKVLR